MHEYKYTLTNKDRSLFLFIDGWFVYQTTKVLSQATLFDSVMSVNFILNCGGFLKDHLNALGLTDIIAVKVSYELKEVKK